jgi:protein-S-isoprenylcysteine O-methyltransferase Ste14
MINSTHKDNAGVIMFPPLLYILILAVGIAGSRLYPMPMLPSSVALPTGILMLLIFFVLLFLAARIFTRHKTTVNPGGVTTNIVSDGIYRYTRNPMYISFTLFYCGVAIISQSWLCFLLLLPLLVLVQKGIIEREEAYLTRKFGKEYLNYKAKVSRWI